jgi:hypothetical protein
MLTLDWIYPRESFSVIHDAEEFQDNARNAGGFRK